MLQPESKERLLGEAEAVLIATVQSDPIEPPGPACGVVADPGNRGATAQGCGGAAMIRRTLPQRRAAETFNLRFWNQPFTVTVGFYADGTPGEVFIDGGKTGKDIRAIARDAGVLLSLALQHGVPPETIRHAVTRDASGEPASILGAIVDCISTNLSSQKETSDGCRP